MSYRKTLSVSIAFALLFALLSLPAIAATPLNAVLSVDNAEANTGDARIRVFHASPDAPAVDVWVDGARAIENLAFESLTGYVGLPAGTYRIQAEPAGANGAGPFVVDANLSFDASTDYTVIATNVLASLTPIILVDDNAAPAAGNAKVRFFHGSPDAPAVDIALTGGPVLVPGTEFQDASGYLEVPAGAYDLEARVAGTDIVALTLPGVVVEDGVVYSAFATGLVAQGSADRTLYLGDGDRFRLDLAVTDFEGNSTFGRQDKLRADTGSFWFLDPANLEVIAKVIDGRGINGNFWVFFGSLSNVEFTLTVTDTVTNTTRTYTNPLGSFASVGDIDAFPGS